MAHKEPANKLDNKNDGQQLYGNQTGEATGATSFAVGTILLNTTKMAHKETANKLDNKNDGQQLYGNQTGEATGATSFAVGTSLPNTTKMALPLPIQKAGDPDNVKNTQQLESNPIQFDENEIEMRDSLVVKSIVTITLKQAKNFLENNTEQAILNEIKRCTKIKSVISIETKITAGVFSMMIHTDEKVSIDRLWIVWPDDGGFGQTNQPAAISVTDLTKSKNKKNKSEVLPPSTLLATTPIKSQLSKNQNNNTLSSTNDSPTKRAHSLSNSPPKSTSPYQNTRELDRKKIEKLNNAYESAYPRKSYSLLLYGDGLLKHNKGFRARVQHISDMKSINEVDCAELQHSKETGESRLKIVVSKFCDFKKLLSPWPSYSFGTGVTPEALPIDDVYVFLMDIETNLVIDSNRKMFRDCEATYGLTNFSRVTKKKR